MMPKIIVTEEDRQKAREKAEKEFPGNKVLQALHYHGYIREIEWKNMTIEEIQTEIRNAKKELRLAR